MIIDTSVLLSAYFPDESVPQTQELIRKYLLGEVHLRAPYLLLYEITNVIRQAERRQRVSSAQGDRILRSVINLSLQFHNTAMTDCLALARQYSCTAYDATYLTLAAQLKEQLITNDQRLYQAAHPGFQWIIRIQDYE